MHGFYARAPHLAWRLYGHAAQLQRATSPVEESMPDLILPLLGLGSFALMAAYALGCERV
ncbi:hypothetical protein [Roseomonas sp. KE2513]|uniref:hypothetical protein n=1 Tax=Roseomonas sp. KE2513 TaxID=2479202 RepID=UPI001E60EB4F|nr:hypothetical protein [Roseomonas sp. KE2513]